MNLERVSLENAEYHPERLPPQLDTSTPPLPEETRSSCEVVRILRAVSDKGCFEGKPLLVRGTQHRMKHYAQKAGLKVSRHQVRHIMATQLLLADEDIVTIQDLLGHTSCQDYPEILAGI